VILWYMFSELIRHKYRTLGGENLSTITLGCVMIGCDP
jgi:hypothetical protein